jgi:hypothetical protein
MLLRARCGHRAPTEIRINQREPTSNSDFQQENLTSFPADVPMASRVSGAKGNTAHEKRRGVRTRTVHDDKLSKEILTESRASLPLA